MHERHAVGTGVELDRRLEVGDRDPDVVDAAEHASECIFGAACGSPWSPIAPSGRRPRSGAARRAMRGAEVLVAGLGELERVAAWAPDRIAVAGGDGTIGPVAELAGRLGVPLAVIPAGTANDFARANGLPLDPRRGRGAGRRRAPSCARSSWAAWPTGARSSTSPAPGWPRVAARRAQPLKSRFGPLAYAIGAARAAADRAAARASASASTARRVFAGDAWQVIVACTRRVRRRLRDRRRRRRPTATSTS